MSHIYKEAEGVIIWLGDSTEESDFIMDSIKRLQENNVRVEGDWRRSAQLWMQPRAGPGGINMLQNNKWREGMVAEMRTIYAGAQEVYVWLGEKKEEKKLQRSLEEVLGFWSEPSRMGSWRYTDNDRFQGSKELIARYKNALALSGGEEYARNPLSLKRTMTRHQKVKARIYEDLKRQDFEHGLDRARTMAQ